MTGLPFDPVNRRRRVPNLVHRPFDDDPVYGGGLLDSLTVTEEPGIRGGTIRPIEEREAVRGARLRLPDLSAMRPVETGGPVLGQGGGGGGGRGSIWDAIEAVGAYNALDPQSEHPVEAGLASALGAFSTVRGARRGRMEDERARVLEEQALRRQIADEAMDRARGQEQFDLDRRYKESQIARTIQQTASEKARFEDAAEVADELDRVGQRGLAAVLRQNPAAWDDDPQTFLRALREGDTRKSGGGTGDMDVATRTLLTAAGRRVEDADKFAAETYADLYGPAREEAAEDLDAFFADVRRQRNPNYAADSTLLEASRRILSGETRTPLPPIEVPADSTRTRTGTPRRRSSRQTIETEAQAAAASGQSLGRIRATMLQAGIEEETIQAVLDRVAAIRGAGSR